MLKRFPSLANSETHAYEFLSDAWDSDARVNMHYRMFQTMGDGMTAHSHSWSITRDYMADYLASIAAAMLADTGAEDEALAAYAGYEIMRRPADKEMAFGASIIWKQDPDSPVERYGDREKKERWYSVELLKVTTSPEKRHDKRYAKVEPWMDGTVKAVYRLMMRRDFPKALECYTTARAVIDWFAEHKNYGLETPAEFLEWTKDYEQAQQLQTAFRAAHTAAKAFELRKAAQRNVDSFKRNLEYERQRKVESAA